MADLQKRSNKTILLIDEVHNLIGRSREMFSAILRQTEFEDFLRHLPTSEKRLIKSIKYILKCFRKIVTDPATIIELNLELTLLVAEFGKHFPDQQTQLKFFEGNLNELQRSIFRFLVIYGLRNDAHNILIKMHQQQVEIHLHCVNAMEFLTSIHQHYKKMILFSATLRPIEYYKSNLGLIEQTDHLILPSPFCRKNNLVIRCDYLDTRWQSRQSTLPDLMNLIQQVVTSKQGNYLAFFPSYQYLNMFADELQSADNIGLQIIKQTPDATDVERQAFIRQFIEPNHPTLGLAVLGGYFAESIDYIGDSLIGCIIVGTGLSPPSQQLDLQFAWFRKIGLNPYLYSQLYPAIGKILQAAGRVIRSETDRGIIVLADNRFQNPEYMNLLPEYWRLATCQRAEDIHQHLINFWNHRA